MIDYVIGHDDAVAQFVVQLIPRMRGRGIMGPYTALGVINGEGSLIGGLVYHNWSPDAGVIEMTGAAIPGSRWLTRETLTRMYAYPFEQLGVQMVVMMAAADDEPLLRQLASIGYMFVTIPRLLGADQDAVACLFTREAWQQCRFIRRPAPIEQKEAA